MAMLSNRLTYLLVYIFRFKDRLMKSRRELSSAGLDETAFNGHLNKVNQQCFMLQNMVKPSFLYHFK